MEAVPKETWEQAKLRDTDEVTIGSCPSVEGSPKARERFSWVIKRAMLDMPVDGELARLATHERRLVKKLRRTASEKRQDVLDQYLEKSSKDEKEALAAAIVSADPEGPDPDRVATAADLIKQLPNIRWLWRDWIPYGMVTLLVAPPGIGKSALALFGIVRPILTGDEWPDKQSGPKTTGKVVWCDVEAAQGINADRIRKWKLPADRILLPGQDVFKTVRLDEDEGKDIDELRELIRVEKPYLVVIDALRSAHHQDENNSGVGFVLERLAALARDTNTAVLVIHHTRKVSSGEAIRPEDARGSNALVAMARSVIGIDEPDPGSAWKRVLVVKTNVTSPPKPFGFKFTSHVPEFGPAPQKPEKETAATEAEDFLSDFLDKGERPATEVSAAAKEKGISEKTLNRAKKNLQIQSKKKSDGWVWRLRRKEDGQKGTAQKP